MEQYNEHNALAARMGGGGWYMKMLAWREKHIKEKTFLVILALVTGIVSGLAAVLLKTLIGTIAGFLTQRVQISNGNLQYLIFPVLGILIASL